MGDLPGKLILPMAAFQSSLPFLRHMAREEWRNRETLENRRGTGKGKKASLFLFHYFVD